MYGRVPNVYRVTLLLVVAQSLHSPWSPLDDLRFLQSGWSATCVGCALRGGGRRFESARPPKYLVDARAPSEANAIFLQESDPDPQSFGNKLGKFGIRLDR